MGKQGSVATLTHIAIWLAIVGSVILILGVDMARALAFPLLILAFIVPLPPFLNQLFTFRLKLISSALSVKMMQVAGISVFRQGNIIDLGVTQLQVVDACSGLRYVYPLFLMGLIFAYLFHKKWWERLLLVGATVPISVVSNALRIAITGFLTAKVSERAAESFFHGFSGWLIFMVSFAFLSMLSLLFKLRERRAKTVKEPETKAETQPIRNLDLNGIRKSYVWVASVLFLLFWGLNGALASAMVKPQRRSLDQFPVQIGEWKGKRTSLREEILAQLWADDYAQIQFVHERTGDVVLFFVPFYAYQGVRHTAHSPVSCLVGGGFAPRTREMIERDFPEPFGRVKIRQMVLEKGGQVLLSNYWFQQRGRIVCSEYWNKWYLFWDSLTRRRTDGALVRLEIPLRPGQDVKAAQASMDQFTRQLMEILPEYVPN
jgi:exosortase D (VPLPA-CTERM-specific)